MGIFAHLLGPSDGGKEKKGGKRRERKGNRSGCPSHNQQGKSAADSAWDSKEPFLLGSPGAAGPLAHSRSMGPEFLSQRSNPHTGFLGTPPTTPGSLARFHSAPLMELGKHQQSPQPEPLTKRGPASQQHLSGASAKEGLSVVTKPESLSVVTKPESLEVRSLLGGRSLSSSSLCDGIDNLLHRELAGYQQGPKEHKCYVSAEEAKADALVVPNSFTMDSPALIDLLLTNDLHVPLTPLHHDNHPLQLINTPHGCANSGDGRQGLVSSHSIPEQASGGSRLVLPTTGTPSSNSVSSKGGGGSPAACIQHYAKGDDSLTARSSPSMPLAKWTEDEDRRLLRAATVHAATNWKLIAKEVATKDHTQCLQRWKRVLRPDLRKGRWMPAEDAQLVALISQGFNNWVELAKHMPGRTSKQCRERWCHHLDPNVKKGEYAPEEDAAILDLQARMGNKWAQIAQHLPGRTENAVKIRYKALTRTRNTNKPIASRKPPSTRIGAGSQVGLREVAALAMAAGERTLKMREGEGFELTEDSVYAFGAAPASEADLGPLSYRVDGTGAKLIDCRGHIVWDEEEERARLQKLDGSGGANVTKKAAAPKQPKQKEVKNHTRSKRRQKQTKQCDPHKDELKQLCPTHDSLDFLQSKTSPSTSLNVDLPFTLNQVPHAHTLEGGAGSWLRGDDYVNFFEIGDVDPQLARRGVDS